MASRASSLGAVSAVLVLPLLAAGHPVEAAQRVPQSFTFVGAGWGHGVGMSQYGSLGQAREGRSASQILRHYYSGAAVERYRDDNDIRVNVGRSWAAATMRSSAVNGRRAPFRVTITDHGRERADRQVRALRLVPAGERVIGYDSRGRRVGSGTRVLVRWSGTRYDGGLGDKPAVLSLTGSSTRNYRYGYMDAVSRGGSLQVVNNVRVRDEYLWGIAEVPASWPSAALQAQAITARSYALTKVGKLRESCNCNVDNGYGGYYDQTFWGYDRETGYMGYRWKAAASSTAVSPTEGQTLTYQGKPLAGFYFSSSGGRTQNSEDVWGGYLAYARSVDDHWSLNASINPNARWSRTWSQASVASSFGLSNVVSIAFERYQSGAVRQAIARSSGGRTAVMSGVRAGVLFGLKSTYYSVSAQ